MAQLTSPAVHKENQFGGQAVPRHLPPCRPAGVNVPEKRSPIERPMRAGHQQVSRREQLQSNAPPPLGWHLHIWTQPLPETQPLQTPPTVSFWFTAAETVGSVQPSLHGQHSLRRSTALTATLATHGKCAPAAVPSSSEPSYDSHLAVLRIRHHDDTSRLHDRDLTHRHLAHLHRRPAHWHLQAGAIDVNEASVGSGERRRPRAVTSGYERFERFRSSRGLCKVSLA